MPTWSIEILEPWWLVGALVIPFVILWSRQSLAGLGPVRKWIAILLRSSLIALILLALADLQLVRSTSQLCTLFLLDRSASIPDAASDAALEQISGAIRRRPKDADLSGLIVFGKSARIELPPAAYPRDRDIRTITASVDNQYSDIGSAIQLALGSIPPGARGRIVLFSDGNQNRGNALAQAVAAQQVDVPIDVVPIEYRYDSEILVDKVYLPAELRRGDTAHIKVIVRAGRPATGLLRLSRVADTQRETLAEERISLEAGLNVKYIEQTIDTPDFYTYEAAFEPDPESEDKRARNNTASGFTWIRGEGRVLFVTNNLAEHLPIIDSLKRDQLVVITRAPDQLREDLAELRPFDAVILANVPSEELGEKRQELLASNTRVLGAGLIMIGGPDSFGPGGYNGSPLEAALPVDMEVKATQITGKGALVLIMHACEIAEGNYWQQKTAQLAVEQLSAQDECGLLQWDGQVSWVFPLQPVGDRRRMLSRIGSMTPGDMPDFGGAMQSAFDTLKKSDALTKHTIIISDGDPAQPTDQLLALYKQAKISITTVAVAAHGSFERQVMRRIASITGGRYYEVTNPKTLPAIYTKETRTVSRPLLYERPNPWSPVISFGGEPVAGLPRESPLPGIRGFVLTTPKPTAVVEIASPFPAELSSSPILAHWQYGLGRAVAFTTDAGTRWAVDWPASPMYSKFWSQLVRWSMRAQSSDRLAISLQEKDGKVRVVVNATGQQGEFLNQLPLQGSVVRPDASSLPLKLSQTEPGKYEGQFDADIAGSYMIRASAASPAGARETAFSALNVSYPPEFRETESRRPFLENLALASGGRVVDADRASATDFFEQSAPPVRRLQDAWPIVLLVALWMFLLDVAVRRIAVEPAEVAAFCRRAWDYVARRPAPARADVTLERLRTVKSKMRGEVSAAPSVIPDFLKPSADAPPAKPITPAAPVEPPTAPATGEESSHTSRLLRAKRQVWGERDKQPPPDPRNDA